MAEFYCKYVSKINNLNMEINSAGIFAYNGFPISKLAKETLIYYNIPVSNNFSSKRLTIEDLEKNDFIFTMERFQADYLKNSYPEYSHKIFNLIDYLGGEGDIEDPAGNSIEFYLKIFEKIKKFIDLLIEKLKAELIKV
jgi:protein-tyrosine-phosphatase